MYAIYLSEKPSSLTKIKRLLEDQCDEWLYLDGGRLIIVDNHSADVWLQFIKPYVSARRIVVIELDSAPEWAFTTKSKERDGSAFEWFEDTF